MFNFNLYAFASALMLIRQEYFLAELMAGLQPQSRLSEKDKARLEQNLQHGIARPLRALFIADDRVGRLFTLVTHNALYSEIAHELKALNSDVNDAIQYERFYHYPKEKGFLVLRVPGDWIATLKAFPSAEEDIKAAVDCYALGYNNASIHHSMMVLEFGLPALAKRLKVRFDKNKASWTPIVTDIRDAIDARRKVMASSPRGSKQLSSAAAKRERSFLEACEEAAIEFRYFTNVWRNHISHGRGDYDENDAKKVLDHVRTFMELIATKLKLKEI